MDRRTALAAITAVPLVAASPARGQGTATPMRAIGLFSVLGEFIDLSTTEEPSASRIDRTARQVLELKGIGFDRIVATEVRNALTRTHPAVHLRLFSGALKGPDQRRLAEGAQRGALPGWMIQSIQDNQLTHVLLVTRHLTEAALETDRPERIGRTSLEGIGFHIDMTYTVRNVATGVVTQGALGPHVLVQLNLFDVEQAKVLRTEVINEQWLEAARRQPVEGGPWNYLNNEEKVQVLRTALGNGVRAALPKLLPGP
jgi:hypothetical protein